MTTEPQAPARRHAVLLATPEYQYNEVYPPLRAATNSVNAMSNNRINANDLHHVVQIMADGAALYTLSNQQPKSEMQYNYLHDYVSSSWADYGSNGIYLDEQTSGFTVAHNAMVNAPTNVVRNQNGTNTITDTPAMDPQAIKAMAGLEAAYADIKTLTAPLPTF